MKDLTRREFVRGGTILAGLAASMLVPGSGPLSKGKAYAAGIDFPESSCSPAGKEGKKVLVAYASRCGTTGDVAEAIGRTLCGAGFEVDTRLAKHVEDVSPYRAVVLGSAVRRASWLPEAIDFTRKHRDVLSRVPVVYFLTCLTLCEDTDDNRKRARSFMEPALKAAPEVRPVGSGFFAGVLDYGKMDAMSRITMKVMGKGKPEGDYRNWDAIASWAKGLTAPLGNGSTSPSVRS